MDYHPQEAEVARAFTRRSDNVTIVADHSKFGPHAPMRVCGLAEVQCLVTDRHPSRAYTTLLRRHGVKLIVHRCVAR